MTIGAAFVLIAAGAILKWAVTAHVHGFDVQTAGTVLFVIGLCALPVALLYAFWSPSRSSSGERGNDTRVMRRPPPSAAR